MLKRTGAASLCLFVFVTASARAQDARIDALQQLNGSVESLVKRVSQTVVQVLVTSYGPVSQRNANETGLVVGRQRSMGSGVIVDGDGYIITNAHVIENARHVEVVLPVRSETGGAVGALVAARGRRVDATIVGVAREIDLALLKVESTALPSIALADYDRLQQGEMVFAFGSPEGFSNSVTMGVVSAVARQPDPDNPMVYVQTDAPINHGNSGGPLVNVKGELVGINTFILSDSGGSQGLGFAIPSALVRIAYQKLRRYGHLHRGELGVILQTITPTLAAGLGLGQDRGAMISDVAPRSPAEQAGLRREDIVLTVDGTPIDSLPRFALELFAHSPGDRVSFQVLRGGEKLAINVPVAERPQDLDGLTAGVEPERSRIPQLGVLGVDVNAENAPLSLRVPSGVMVVAHTQDDAGRDEAGLVPGDTIHAINGHAVASVQEVRATLAAVKRPAPVVFQIERGGQFVYLAFDLE